MRLPRAYSDSPVADSCPAIPSYIPSWFQTNMGRSAVLSVRSRTIMSESVDIHSSIVPMPPGSTTNTSPAAIILPLRSFRSRASTISSQSASARPLNTSGTTPVTFAPAVDAASATSCISPAFTPPYTISPPIAPIAAAICRAPLTTASGRP